MTQEFRLQKLLRQFYQRQIYMKINLETGTIIFIFTEILINFINLMQHHCNSFISTNETLLFLSIFKIQLLNFFFFNNFAHKKKKKIFFSTHFSVLSSLRSAAFLYIKCLIPMQREIGFKTTCWCLQEHTIKKRAYIWCIYEHIIHSTHSVMENNSINENCFIYYNTFVRELIYSDQTRHLIWYFD